MSSNVAPPRVSGGARGDDAAVAQWIEQRNSTPMVGGSTPSRRNDAKKGRVRMSRTQGSQEDIRLPIITEANAVLVIDIPRMDEKAFEFLIQTLRRYKAVICTKTPTAASPPNGR